MLKRVAQVLGLVVVLPLLAYLLFWPTPIQPQAWTPPKAPAALCSNLSNRQQPLRLRFPSHQRASSAAA